MSPEWTFLTVDSTRVGGYRDWFTDKTRTERTVDARLFHHGRAFPRPLEPNVQPAAAHVVVQQQIIAH
jgi:hypothetical protein